MSRKLSLLILMALLPILADADPVEIDGICYNLYAERKIAEVAGIPANYSGEVVIPESVSYENVLFNVTHIGSMAFNHCSGLTSLTIPNSVLGIPWGAFAGCSNLTSVTIGGGVTYIGNYATSSFADSWTVFNGCTSLTSIEVDDSNTKFTSKDGVLFSKDMTYLICYPAGKTGASYSIPNSVTSIAVLAFDNKDLTSVTIPNSVTYIPSEAFYGRSSLTSVISEITEPFALSSEVFNSDVYSNATLYVPVGTKEKYEATDGWKLFSNIVEMENELSSNIEFADEKVKALCVENWDTNGDGELSYDEAAAVKNFKYGGVFGGNEEITSFNELQFFLGLTEIGMVDFGGCVNLTSVTFPNSLKSIGWYAFVGCGLTSVTIPSSVTSIDHFAFSQCNKLTSIIVEEGNTVYSSKDGILFNKEMTTIACYPPGKTETSYTIPNNVNTIGNGAFIDCSNLISVIIHSGVTSIGESNLSNPFNGCSSLTSIVVDEGNTEYTSLDGVLFNKDMTRIVCYPPGKKDTSYTIPDGVRSIGYRAFLCCNNLTAIKIPNSVTYIGIQAIDLCEGLTSLSIPSSVTTIDKSAFDGCNGIKDIYCYSESVPRTSNNFGLLIEKITLHVPEGSIEAYKTAVPWKDFKEIVAIVNDDTDNYIEATCAQVIAGEDGAVYRVTGRVAQIVNTKYGNWYLEDETGQIYIYGTVDGNGSFPYLTSWESFGINEGDIVTVQGPKTTYNGTTELVNVSIIKPIMVTSITSNNDAYKQSSTSGSNIESEATDITFSLYCDGDVYAVDILDGASSWLTLTSRTEGKYPVVVFHAKENNGAVRRASLQFTTTKDGQVCVANAYVYQYSGKFIAQTAEGVDMSFRILSDDADNKTCAVWGGGVDLSTMTNAISTETSGHVTIPEEVNGYKVYDIYTYAFRGCEHLTGITIPETVTGFAYESFGGCTNLVNINFPSSLINIVGGSLDDTAWYANQPDGVIYTGPVLYGYKGNMLENTNIAIIEGCKATASKAFQNQKNLIDVMLPSTLTRIYDQTFEGTGIKKIVIPANVERISSMAFWKCLDLEEVTFMGLTDYLAKGVFSNCPNLKGIVRYSAEPSRNVNAKAFLYNDMYDADIYDRVTLYVPKGSKTNYQEVQPWSLFKNIVETDDLKPVEEGDANEDGDVNAEDIVDIVNHSMGKPTSTGKFNEKAADANEDGIVNAADIVTIVNGIISNEED